VIKLYHCDISKMTDEEFEKLYFRSEASRRKKAKRLKNQPDKKLSIAAGELVRQAISEEFNIDKNDIRFRVNKGGKPYTESVKAEFSISHSKDIAVCAISDRPVGIDIEYMRNVNIDVAKKYFTENEQKYVFEKPKLSNQRFFEIWTKKEAYVKLYGKGIPYFKEFSVIGNENIETYIRGNYVVSVAKTK